MVSRIQKRLEIGYVSGLPQTTQNVRANARHLGQDKEGSTYTLARLSSNSPATKKNWLQRLAA